MALHRQYVFTIPRILRPIFSRRRRLLGVLCQIIEGLIRENYAAAKPGCREAMILFVQTFGDLVTFNPHVHVLAVDGVFGTTACECATPPGGKSSRNTCCVRRGAVTVRADGDMSNDSLADAVRARST